MPDKAEPLHCYTEFDPEIDDQMVALVQRAALLLRAIAEAAGKVLPKTELELKLKGWFLYLAASAAGAAVSTLCLILHNRGREARWVARSLGEFTIKAMYFLDNSEEAEFQWDNYPAEMLQFMTEGGITSGQSYDAVVEMLRG